MAIATKLVDAFYIVEFIVFISGFRHLIPKSLVRDVWIADLVFGAGLFTRQWFSSGMSWRAGRPWIPSTTLTQGSAGAYRGLTLGVWCHWLLDDRHIPRRSKLRNPQDTVAQ
jgi:hypothetical protein